MLGRQPVDAEFPIENLYSNSQVSLFPTGKGSPVTAWLALVTFVVKLEPNTALIVLGLRGATQTVASVPVIALLVQTTDSPFLRVTIVLSPEEVIVIIPVLALITWNEPPRGKADTAGSLQVWLAVPVKIWQYLEVAVKVVVLLAVAVEVHPSLKLDIGV